MAPSIVCTCLSAIVAWCVSGIAVGAVKCDRGSSEASGKRGSTGDVLTIFLTGHELGAMKPCGCSGGQLGGLDRRPAVLNRAAKEERLVIDTGTLVASDGEQDLLKFSTIMQAFKLAGYDLVSFSCKDVEIAASQGLLAGSREGLRIISACSRADVNLPAAFTKELALKDRKVAVTVAAFDVESGTIEQAERLFSSRSDKLRFNILILSRCEPDAVVSLAKRLPAVDCIVCPPVSDEPSLLSEQGKRPLVLSVGRLGKYVNRLRVSAAAAPDGLTVVYSPVDVNETLAQDASLVNLYKAYQRLVKDEMLVERYPRLSLPAGLRYADSQSCKSCHEYEYEQWSTKPHAQAYATLEKVGSQFDPECVICHVVGMKYDSGFVSAEQTGNLKDVGCENCHGPGSEHNGAQGKTPTTEPKTDCTGCHTPEHSSAYAGKKLEYLEKIKHWKELKSPRNVK